MSWLSEQSDTVKGVVLGLGLTGAGLVTEAGRKGFEENIPAGLGTSMGAGLRVVFGVPYSYVKGVAEGTGLVMPAEMPANMKITAQNLGLKIPKEGVSMTQDEEFQPREQGLGRIALVFGFVALGVLVAVLIAKKV